MMQSRKPLASLRAKCNISSAIRGVRSQGSDTSVQAKCCDLAARNSSNKRSESSCTASVCSDLLLLIIVLVAVVFVAAVAADFVIILSQFNLFEELEALLLLLDVFRFCCFR